MATQEEIVEHLGNLSIVQFIELTRTLEEKWGVKAEPVAFVSTALRLDMPAAAPPVADEVSVVLTEVGGSHILVIKNVREALGLALLDGKRLVERVNAGERATLREGITRAEAEALKTTLEEVGAKVEIR